MISLEGDLSYLSLEQVQKLKCRSEKDFALRCLAVGCLLVSQIQIGESVIDFLVINPKRHQNDKQEPRGKLVEVTSIDEAMVESKETGLGKKILREMRERKQRQVEAMKVSDYPWTILYSKELKNIKKSAKAKC